MNIFEKLTADEISMINEYRNDYAWASDEDGYDCDRIERNRVSTEEVLAPWAEAKENLYHLFGDRFIIEEEVEMNKSNYDLREQLADMLVSGLNIFDIRNVETIDKAKAFYAMLRRHRSLVCGPCYWQLEELFNLYTLAENRYTGETFIYENIKVQKGCKPTKVIAKFAKLWNIDGFEEFRLVHSLGLNNKKFKGRVCLSIHPLDYMTMSDNECGWESCMSWQHTGCYRQGTVEMMNSPYVVVGYLRAENDMGLRYNQYWNNKKWRQLFIVHPNIITGVKEYPYHSDELNGYCLDKLRALFTNGEYSDNKVNFPSHCSFNDYDLTFGGEQVNLTNVKIHFDTTYMYNDFGSVEDYPVYIGSQVQSSKSYHITYSGASECMWCGSTDVRELEGNTLLCNDCYRDNYVYCNHCDERVHEDDAYLLDGDHYCHYCYNEYAVEVVNDRYNDVHHIDNCFRVAWVNPEDGKSYELIDENSGVSAHFYVSGKVDFLKEVEAVHVDVGSYWNSDAIYLWKMANAGTVHLEVSREKLEEIMNKYNLSLDEYATYYGIERCTRFTTDNILI